MLKNYFKIAFRNLWRNRGFSAIHIMGLVLGIATCLLILLFIQNELSYDRYNEKADRMVRVIFRGKMQQDELKEATVMPPVAQTIKNDYPEVQEVTRIRAYGMPRIAYGNTTFKDDKFAFVDANFFEVFTIPLIKGNAKTALQQPNSIIVSKAIAQKYFGSDDPIGKVLTFKDNNTALTVTGEVDEVPVNSHFHFGIFASMSSLPEAKEQDWMSSNFFTYLVLPEGYNYKKLEAKLPQMVDKYIGPQMQKSMGVTLAQFRQSGNSIGFFLQPLTDIHLRSDLTGDMEPYGNISYLYIFGAVATFMLLIACINFMNLSTAGASKRAKEVGIRKVMGSVKSQLVHQFLMESLLLTTIALVLATLLVYWTLPFFNTLASQQLSFKLLDHLWMLPGLLLFGAVTGILAGSYPAFFLSSFNPVTVLKGRFSSGKRSAGLRSGLVVFQFFISISLIIGTAVVYKQLTYIQNKQLGYDKEQVLIIQDTYWLGNNDKVFRQQLLQDPQVTSVSASSYLPAGPTNNNNFFVYPDNHSTQLIKTLKYDIDEGYIPTLGIQLAAGRNFSSGYGTDSTGIIINQTAAQSFGWGSSALGHTITRQENEGRKATYTVIGVVKDFHFKSLHERITPLVMIMGKDNSNLIVKVKTSDMAGLLSTIKNKWDALKPEAAFSYSFLNERFYNTYIAEQNIGRVLGIFAGLTIFVACLGLFGLATFTAERRIKEIGIRKVLGASVGGLVSLLSKDFFRLVSIAFLVATPISWLVMNKWLQDFAYRIQISWQVFVIAAFITILITMFTISFQAVKAAIANPVKSLRTE